MADDSEDAGTDDIPTDDRDGGRIHKEVPRWVKSGGWICSIVIALPVLYFFIYPPLALVTFRVMGMPYPVPSSLEKSIVPIEWLGEKIELYDRYTSWVSQHIL